MHMSALNMIQMHSTAFLQKNSEFPILLFHSNGVCECAVQEQVQNAVQTEYSGHSDTQNKYNEHSKHSLYSNT